MWHSFPDSSPPSRRLVLALMPDATKEVLAFHDGIWWTQHSTVWLDPAKPTNPAPLFWHELPPPPEPPPFRPVRAFVHILRYGSPMCRFTTALPGSWPPGHRWVSFEDDLSDVDCESCRFEYGYPECPICNTTRRGSEVCRVDRTSGGGEMLEPCVNCGKPTPWRTSGTRSSFPQETLGGE